MFKGVFGLSNGVIHHITPSLFFCLWNGMSWFSSTKTLTT